jgi:hypothetical protein
MARGVGDAGAVLQASACSCWLLAAGEPGARVPGAQMPCARPPWAQGKDWSLRKQVAACPWAQGKDGFLIALLVTQRVGKVVGGTVGGRREGGVATTNAIALVYELARLAACLVLSRLQ